MLEGKKGRISPASSQKLTKEADEVEDMLKDAPTNRYYNFDTDWRPKLLELERVEAPGQLLGCESYAKRVRSAFSILPNICQVNSVRGHLSSPSFRQII